MEVAGAKVIVDEPLPYVSRLRISNPDKRGALDPDILDALAKTIPGLEARCLLVTGTERVFSAGYDLGDLGSRGESFVDLAEALLAHPFTAAIEALDAYPYPTIAAINGHAIGGGLELAVTCDIRIAADGIKLGMPPGKLGVIYSHTGVQRFLDACGVANTSELLLFGRYVDTDRGREMGLLNRVVEPEQLEEVALEYAAEAVSEAPLSVKGNKDMIRALRRARWDLDKDLVRELLELRASCFLTEDLREGVRAFGEKRAPEWRGR